MKKYRLNSLAYLIVVIFFITTNSCNDNSTDNSGDFNNFLFRVVVKNSSGQALQGLRVSAYNDPSGSGLAKIQTVNSVNKISSLSSLRYDLEKACRVTLLLLEHDGAIIQRVITENPQEAGAYRVQLSLRDSTAGTRVYKAVLTAVDDTTNAVLFKDSVYLTLWQPDASLSVLGYTSSTGIVETTDSLKFPHLLALPTMVRTADTGDSLGIFTLPDDVVITVFDAASQKSQSFVRKVSSGKNEFELTWDSSPNPMLTHPFTPPQFSVTKTDTVVRPIVVPHKFRLYQNYPNPFN